jgi:hypothetical protein
VLKKLLTLLLLILCVPVCQGSRQQLLLEPPPAQVPAGVPLSSVEKVVLACADQYQWLVESRKAGSVTMSYGARGVSATVKVSYDEKQVRISYVDSRGLSYEQEDGKAYIHYNYNRWVNALAHSIQAQLVDLAPQPAH